MAAVPLEAQLRAQNMRLNKAMREALIADRDATKAAAKAAEARAELVQSIGAAAELVLDEDRREGLDQLLTA